MSSVVGAGTVDYRLAEISAVAEETAFEYPVAGRPAEAAPRVFSHVAYR